MRTAILILAALAIALNTYATKFHLALAAPLAQQNEVLDVKGRNGILIRQKLSFGDFHTIKVKRGAIKKWEGYTGVVGLIWTSHMEGKQSIQFQLTDNMDTSHVMMVTNVESRDLNIGSNPDAMPNKLFPILTIGDTDFQKNNLSTAIYLSPNEAPWELFLDNTAAQLKRSEYIGYVYRGDVAYKIVPVWDIVHKGKIRQLPFGTAGFEIQNEKGEALAAVSLMDDRGIVYMGKLDQKERFLMANICSALLLQSVI